MTAHDAVEHFERVASGYATMRDRGLRGILRRQEQRALREVVRIQQNDRVLDVGCGDGATLRWLRAGGARAVGVDLALGMARRCHASGLPVCVQDMEALGVQPGFDWVLCVGALEFARTPAAAMASFAACLRPAGRLALLFPRRSWLGILYAAYHRVHGVRVHLFARAEILAAMRQAGLSPLTGWREGWLSTVAVAERPGQRAPSASN